MATSPVDSSVGVPNTGPAAIRTETVKDSTGATVIEQVIIAEGIAADAPTIAGEGDTSPVSLTSDRRLRVRADDASELLLAEMRKQTQLLNLILHTLDSQTGFSPQELDEFAAEEN